jgi:hypothetical protein
MTDEQLAAMLGMLKIDLGIATTAYDSRLAQYLKNAEEQITREGVTLDYGVIGDQQITVMYAAWTWRRRDTGEGMPRMLRYTLNNRIFSGKVKADG